MNNKERPPIQEKDALWQLFTRTNHFMAKVRERELMKLSISQFTASVIFTALRQGKGATPASIAEEMLLEPHTISEQLTRMQESGLIRKARDPQKRSRTFVEVTEKGHEVFRRSCERTFTRKVMSVLTAEERGMLWRMLSRLRDKALEETDTRVRDLYPPSNRTKLKEAISNLKGAMSCDSSEERKDKAIRRRRDP